MLEHPLLGGRVEREADELMAGLLMDGREALEHDLIHRGTLPSASASPRRWSAFLRLATGPPALPGFEPPDCLTSPDLVPHSLPEAPPQPPGQEASPDSTSPDRSPFADHVGLQRILRGSSCTTGNPNSRLRRPLIGLLPILLIVLTALVLPSVAHTQDTDAIWGNESERLPNRAKRTLQSRQDALVG